MNPSLLACTLCGNIFNPDQHPACGSCPLVKGCQMACCPVCGHHNVVIDRSKLGQWIKRVMKRKSQ